MIKVLTSFLNYSVFAELSLIIFAIVFAAVVIRTIRMKKESTDDFARIVLADHESRQETK